ncbi:hypothetical protein BGY98DRAFT_934898 [Russula aff. rugulosa BPL654]|nr:hypothetical protein BGY98DRAFT_934898 [Russula aff. rugulosa BPL654]
MWRREVKIIHTKEGKHTGNTRSCLVHQELHITPQLGARVNEIPLAVMKEFYPRSREGAQQSYKNTYDPSYPPPTPPFTYTRVVVTRTLVLYYNSASSNSSFRRRAGPGFRLAVSVDCGLTRAPTHASTHARQGTGEDKLYYRGQIEDDIRIVYPSRAFPREGTSGAVLSSCMGLREFLDREEPAQFSAEWNHTSARKTYRCQTYMRSPIMT